MAMGTRKQREKQEGLWIAHTELATAPGHPFYQKLNELLEAEGFDEFVEQRCAKFYAAKYGRPSLTPGIYFRSLLIGYFEGIGAERGIAWRLADSLALRRFVGIALDEYTPDHSTISRTRRLIDVDTHREVFTWVLGVLADHGLLQGQRIAISHPRSRRIFFIFPSYCCLVGALVLTISFRVAIKPCVTLNTIISNTRFGTMPIKSHRTIRIESGDRKRSSSQ